jgi:RNA polymerase sigma-70 factor (ECF subfamily)
VNDDSELIEQTLQGRPAAFGVLVRKYQDRLFNTLAHLLGDVEDAQDVVQDSFIQAFLKLETFQHSSAFYTWLYRIAMNMAATLRRRKRPVLSVDRAREATGREPIDLGEGPTERLERQERQQQVRQAIAQLPEEYRAVVVLREIEGFCYETIAEILDLPIGTVRSRLHRARFQLRDQLKEVLTVKK